jgi:hypothetical protein
MTQSEAKFGQMVRSESPIAQAIVGRALILTSLLLLRRP